MAVDLSTLTLAEIEEIERRSKMSIGMLEKPDAPKGAIMRALALIVMRRSDPAATWESTAALTMGQITDMVAQPTEDPQ